MSAPSVLVIGGTDSSGGAGISRDVVTLAAFDVPVAIAITAVTAQTDGRVSAIHHVPPSVIVEQITTALAARPIAVIKIGMLGCSASLQAVVAAISNVTVPIVLDPVLVSSSGRALLEAAALVELRAQLLPRATLLTPNIPEAAALLQSAAAVHESALVEQARALLALGPRAVLLKNGHGSGARAVDLLLSQDSDIERLAAPRLPIALRGTGCMLASAIAAGLAMGKPLLEACTQAKGYVTAQLQAASYRDACSG
jgi:hydroxymethylpyrimidine/phosphomethylpyrimidine kinase